MTVAIRRRGRSENPPERTGSIAALLGRVPLVARSRERATARRSRRALMRAIRDFTG